MEEKLNDNVVIPEDIKKMTRKELKEAIKALEAEESKKRDPIKHEDRKVV